MVDGVRIAIAGGVTFVIVALLVPVARRYALRNGITDNPAPGKSHASPTPYLGGVAIALGAVACSAVLPEWQSQAAVILAAAALVGGDRPLRRRPHRASEHATPGGGERGDGRCRRRCARPTLRRPARLRDHRGVDRRHHELVQPARQHGRRRRLDRHRHRVCAGGHRAARGPAPRGWHGGRGRRRLPGLPALQLAPGADLHGRRRFVVPRVRPRRHRLEAADAGAARGEHRRRGPARRPGGLRHDAGGDLHGCRTGARSTSAAPITRRTASCSSASPGSASPRCSSAAPRRRAPSVSWWPRASLSPWVAVPVALVPALAALTFLLRMGVYSDDGRGRHQLVVHPSRTLRHGPPAPRPRRTAPRFTRARVHLDARSSQQHTPPGLTRAPSPTGGSSPTTRWCGPGPPRAGSRAASRAARPPG